MPFCVRNFACLSFILQSPATSFFTFGHRYGRLKSYAAAACGAGRGGWRPSCPRQHYPVLSEPLPLTAAPAGACHLEVSAPRFHPKGIQRSSSAGAAIMPHGELQRKDETTAVQIRVKASGVTMYLTTVTLADLLHMMACTQRERPLWCSLWQEPQQTHAGHTVRPSQHSSVTADGVA